MHFDGLGRTKDDIIMYEISDVFKAKNLIDVSVAVNNRLAVKKLIKFLSLVFLLWATPFRHGATLSRTGTP